VPPESTGDRAFTGTPDVIVGTDDEHSHDIVLMGVEQQHIVI